MRVQTQRRWSLAVIAVLALCGLVGCAGSGAPAPAIPDVTYAGVPGDESSSTSPDSLETPEPAATADDETVPSANPAVDDVLQYAAIGGSEITGQWHGGCRITPAVGLSGMTWRGTDLVVADGSALRSVTIEVSIRSTADDGTLEVESFSVQASFADGRDVDVLWTAGQQAGEVYGTSSQGVSSLRLEAPESIGSFDVRAYCD